MKRTGKMTRRLVVLVIVAIAAVYQYFEQQVPVSRESAQTDRGVPADVRTADWRSGDWVQLEARVVRVLSDDNSGSRHQRFIVEVPGQRTLLIAHNIDLADRVPLTTGDQVEVRGQFEPNERGGVIHWTHHDPRGGAGGWIEYHGRRYQ